LAEHKLSLSGLALYNFYRSISNWQTIRPTYDYLAENTGLAKGTISEANNELQDLGLIKLLGPGANHPYEVKVVPLSKFPIRVLKNLRLPEPTEEEIQQDIDEWEHREENALDKSLSQDQKDFLLSFTRHWCSHMAAKFYPRDDFDKVFELEDPKNARVYIKYLWDLEEKYYKTSDYSLTVFVAAYKRGKVQAYYRRSADYLRDMTRLGKVV
jgi:hypothetical protein